MSKATEPYSSCGFRNAVLYKDKIYFCGNVEPAPQIWQVDTKTDECKFVYGMSVQDFMVGYRQGISTGIRGLCVYEETGHQLRDEKSGDWQHRAADRHFR